MFYKLLGEQGKKTLGNGSWEEGDLLHVELKCGY